MVIQTPRLQLRLMERADAPLLYHHLTSDPESVRYIQWQRQNDIGEATALVASCLEEIASLKKLYFVAESREGDTVGFASLTPGNGVAHIGFAVVTAQRNRGYAKEIIAALVQRAFAGSMDVHAVCDCENVASGKVLESSGFTQQARLSKFGTHPNLGPEPRDCFLYVKQRPPEAATS